ncbi:MAG: diguanylate cyclase [Epsilonproteobacteria bacterium]|nr:diguanylate cyclase [Campylobacterota bacterium]
MLLVLSASAYLINKSTIDSLVVKQLTNKTKERVDFFNEIIKHETRILSAISKNRELLLFAQSNSDKQAVENLFVTIEQTEDDIYDIRFIDLNGKEIVRVNNYKEPRIVQKKALQDKHNRYYFKEAIKKSKGEVYYSNIDLNFEHGVVQKSKIPTIRIAIPIVVNGIKKGIVVMNVNMTEYLEDLKKATLYYVYLVYGDGSIICDGSKYNSDKNFEIKTNITKIYSFIPKNISKYNILKTNKFLLYKFPLDTPRKIYMILVPRKFNQYLEFESSTKKIVIFLIFITLLGFPIGYVISNYIEKIYLEKIDMKKQIYIDELTKVYNRKAYNEKIQENLDLFKRYDTKFCIALLDIDNFKKVNDTYGHINGDRVLKVMSKSIKGIIRKTDTIFRIGGEEFVIIFSNTKLEDAYIVSEKIRLAVATNEIIKDTKVTISIGLSESKKDDDVDTMFKRIDKLLYKSKQDGKNKTSFI